MRALSLARPTLAAMATMLGAKHFGGHAFEINPLGFANSFLGQSVGGEKLHGKSAH